jgi:hypothetical protein
MDAGPEKGIAADVHSDDVEQDTIDIEVDIFAQLDVVPVVTEKGRSNVGCNGLSEKHVQHLRSSRRFIRT